MNEPLAYRGRTIGADDIALIGSIIAQNPRASRRKLSVLLCQAWDWRQANGACRDMVCRSLMLMLHRAGHIELPPKRQSPTNPLAQRVKPATDFLLDRSPLQDPLRRLQPLVIRQVRRTDWESLFNGLIERDHYLGYIQPVGEHLKYMVFAQDRPIACLGWSSAPRQLNLRDRFVGAPKDAYRHHLHRIAYNTRFLIVPWVEVPHLASHLLGRVARRLSDDWQALYHHPIDLLESFVDTERFRGTCYRAANWVCVGRSVGRGTKSKTAGPTVSIKELWVYPLHRHFRQRLLQAPCLPSDRSPS